MLSADLSFSKDPEMMGSLITCTQVLKVLALLMLFGSQKGQLSRHSCYCLSTSSGLILSSTLVSFIAGHTDPTALTFILA